MYDVRLLATRFLNSKIVSLLSFVNAINKGYYFNVNNFVSKLYKGFLISIVAGTFFANST